MKIFVSHSSKQKLFVKELKRYLPPSVQLWIDEYEIIIGDNIESLIEKSIFDECDYFFPVIDTYSVNSNWVAKEIEFAINKEKVIGHTFLLPIVIDKEAWDKLQESELKGRKYLYCSDFTDSTIKNLCENIVNELFTALSRDLKFNRRKKLSNQLQKLNDAEKMSTELARSISTIVHPYRNSNPLKLLMLMRELKKYHVLDDNISIDELKSVIKNLIGYKKLSGIKIAKDDIYVSQERYSNKYSIHIEGKRKIAEEAFKEIKPGQIIALDGGSTTLELAKLISNGIKQGDLDGLKIITNSIPAAFEILTTLSDLGLNDNNSICNIYIFGGWARPISMTLISDRISVTYSDMNSIFTSVGKADICFLGTNGVHGEVGFAVHSTFEVAAKKSMVLNSKKKIVLADSSKFKVQQEIVFAKFEEGLIIITIRGDNDEVLDEFCKIIQSTTSKIIIIE